MKTFRWLLLMMSLASLPLSGITPNAVEVDIANLAINHLEQHRPTMVYDPILNVVARAKALDLGRRAYFNHTDPDGYGPNKAVDLAGYDLPASWTDDLAANYIESIGGGYATAQDAFDGWMGSAGHRRHLLGETDFYASQTRYGVGYAEIPGSPYQRYYVFISAPPGASGNAPLQPYIEWLFTYFTPFQIDTTGDASDTDADGIGRLLEFVLQFHPKQIDRLPSARLNPMSRRLEWMLPLRADLGSVTVAVQRTFDLRAWTTNGVQRTGGTFSIDTQPPNAFLRLNATRGF